MTNNHPHKNWMAASPAIDNLTLMELVWPGAHNAGMDYDFPYLPHLQPFQGWFVCQEGPFIQQLNEGVRALDLRFLSDEHWLGIRKFHTFHGYEMLTGRSLAELFKSLSFFLNENPDEFVILDIHELQGRDERQFDYQGFHDAIISELGTRLIPKKNRYLTLGELKKTSSLQRVVLACDWHPDLDSPLYWPKINHRWSRSDVTSPEALRHFIQHTLTSPPDEDLLWSLSATSYTKSIGVMRLTQELNDWFGPNSGWAPKCSIINADYIGDTQLVAYCREINFSRGLQKT
ncbi:phospholipase [Pseudomonas sp. C32]|uniref:phospholipase n=1 Tax=Pseudomonas sp. C32 TaxID=1529208 RepID=UPI002629DDF9|nr:phospholipase [Pseudomonas sp. C32]MDN4546232.1 phospholipase [Pseudomonas sp. C32]